MKAKWLNFKKVLHLIETYMRQRGKLLIRSLTPPKIKKGRPKKYPDEIILTMLFLQIAWKLSFRDVELFAASIFERKNIPDFSTYYYRLKQIPLLLLIDFISFLSNNLLKKYYKEIALIIIDGTGFKYNELYPLKILRGKEIKEIKSHVKVVALSVHLKNGKRFILRVAAGGSYASEVKLGREILKWIVSDGFIREVLRNKPFLGDKAYDSIEFIKELVNLGFRPYIRVRETFRKGIKSGIRKLCKELIKRDRIYRERGRIESIFGELKQDLGSYERTKNFKIAELFVMAKFVLFNLWFLSLLEKFLKNFYLRKVQETWSFFVYLVNSCSVYWLLIFVNIFQTASDYPQKILQKNFREGF